jgi:hypothetical protein
MEFECEQRPYTELHNLNIVLTYPDRTGHLVSLEEGSAEEVKQILRSCDSSGVFSPSLLSDLDIGLKAYGFNVSGKLFLGSSIEGKVTWVGFRRLDDFDRHSNFRKYSEKFISYAMWVELGKPTQLKFTEHYESIKNR